jgi:hypothetical protein
MTPQKESPAPISSGSGAKRDCASTAIRNHESSGTSLAGQQRSWGLPSDKQIGRLLDLGFGEFELCEPWPIGAVRARFHGETFTPDPDGKPCLTFRIEDGGRIVDLAAWRSGTQIATFCGAGFAIGQSAIFNPATWFANGGLKVHATPLDWLADGRRGIVITRPSLSYAMLRHVPRLIFSDAALARRVRGWMAAPKPSTLFLVETEERRAA